MKFIDMLSPSPQASIKYISVFGDEIMPSTGFLSSQALEMRERSEKYFCAILAILKGFQTLLASLRTVFCKRRYPFYEIVLYGSVIKWIDIETECF